MSLLERLKTSLTVDESASASDRQHDLQIAAAVLLLEMERADDNLESTERNEMQRQLEQMFDLTASESEELLSAAEPTADEAITLHRFVEAINEAFDIAQKRAVLTMLWRVAFADGDLDAHEEHLMRNVADWLHLAHRNFIQTKLAVTEGEA